MNIFISYRRDDSSVHARLLYKELLGYFDADEVFMDIQDIGYGDDFADLIDQRLEQSEVVLVVVGPRWVEMVEQRLRGDDWVRHEVKRALALRAKGRLRLLPVMVGGAAWGAPLPADLAKLQRLSFLPLADRRFDEDLRTVVEAIRQRRIWDELLDAIRGRRARLAGIALGALVFIAGWVALFDFFGVDTRLATTTMWLAGSAATPAWSGKVVLIAIDKQSEAVIGRSFDASWRAEHARLIDRAAAAGARTLAFDVVLGEIGVPAANADLQAALERTRSTLPVVFGADRSRSAHPQITALTDRAGSGVACAGSKLGLARSLPLVVRRAADGALLPSLALAAYSGGGRVEAIDETAQRVLVRVAPEDRSALVGYFAAETIVSVQDGCRAITPGDRVATQLIDPATIPALTAAPQRIAYEAVLRGDAAALHALRDRVALVGVLREGEDILTVPGSARRWGAELIATQIDGLFRNAAIRSTGPLSQAVVSIGLGLGGAVIVVALHRHGRIWTALALLVTALLFWAGAVLWYRLELQLVSLPYGLTALAFGALGAAQILKGRPK